MIQGTDLELFERSLRQATSNNTGPALDAALAEVGWSDALGYDTRTAVSVLFSLQGLTNTSSSALDLILASALRVNVPRGTAFLLPPLGDWSPPAELKGSTANVAGVATAVVGSSGQIVVATRTAAAHNGTGGMVVGKVETAQLTLRPLQGLDPELGLVEVTGQGVAFTPLEQQSGCWDDAVRVARLAVSHELVGAARAMLELARDHALNRIQFGQPISRFQAVRHRLAETLVAIEGADGVLSAAWQEADPLLAASAKALSGRGARTAARHCQQVLAGIGFTAEHPFHRYLRRVIVLDQLFGTERALTEAMGRDLLARREIPALLAL